MSTFIFSFAMNLSRSVRNNHFDDSALAFSGTDPEGSADISHSLSNGPESRAHHSRIGVVQCSWIKTLSVIFHRDPNLILSKANANCQPRCLRMPNRIIDRFL